MGIDFESERTNWSALRKAAGQWRRAAGRDAALRGAAATVATPARTAADRWRAAGSGPAGFKPSTVLGLLTGAWSRDE